MKGAISFFWDTAKVIIIALIIVLPIRAFIFQPFLVKGDSMKPNFHNGDYLIIDELSYRFHNPQRGDVIVFNFPLDATQRYIKRIIGLPGETVDINKDIITILKGEEKLVLSELYIPQAFQTLGTVHETLKENEYFVLGDNRPFSSDSRVWGIVPKTDVIGKVFIRVFPPNAFTILTAPAY